MSSLFKSTTTYDPIFMLLNSETEEERDRLTERWRDCKLEELNFVGIVSALLASVLTSTGSWPTILTNGTLQPWTVRASFYCGLMFALGSVLVAAHQSIRLHRLSSHRHATTNIRRLLSQGHPCRHTGHILPRRMQVYAWQMSVLFLLLAVLCMLCGLCILIWSGTGSGFPFGNWWNEEAKLAVTFSIVVFVITLMLGAEIFTLYSWAGQDDSNACNSDSNRRGRYD